jgi:5-methylthioadenosine/S-adenosylhomocysteine deaminase
MARLDRIGLLGPQLVAVHMTQLEDAEIARLAETGSHVVHCPESNLKLASGFCPVARLLAAGVNVALGTDGAASNNDLNLLAEMRTAALLAKGVAGSASAVPAETALRMATINGAKALGIDDETGSLEVGKAADIVAVDLRNPHTSRSIMPARRWSTPPAAIRCRQVWIAGRQVIRDGQPLTLEPDAIASRGASVRSSTFATKRAPTRRCCEIDSARSALAKSAWLRISIMAVLQACLLSQYITHARRGNAEKWGELPVGW